MKTVGIVCEYNPLHLGHEKQIRRIRREFGEDTAVVCAMSGSFVQRGHPAILDKSLRAEAAAACGADLVLELPVPVSLSSAEGFARGGVEILSRVCDTLCFGAETGEAGTLMDTARRLQAPEFDEILRNFLSTGISYPAAREKALAALGGGAEVLRRPNDILAVEYCKAIVASGSGMAVFPIRREGDYHDTTLRPDNPSATAVRRQMLLGTMWQAFVPAAARPILEGGALHTLQAGERAVLSRLRTMDEGDFQALPYGSEGLWRKLFHGARRAGSLEELATAVKSKRYTRSRLDRMVMCAYLGITADLLQQPAPYVRVLAFTGRGREILHRNKSLGWLRNAGEKTGGPYWQLENRWEDLYGLFRVDRPDAGGAEQRRRVRCLP